MLSRQRIALAALLLVTGCTWPVRQATNQTLRRMADQPFDVRPDGQGTLPIQAQAQTRAPTQDVSAEGRTGPPATSPKEARFQPAPAAKRDRGEGPRKAPSPQIAPAPGPRNELRYAAATDAGADVWLNPPPVNGPNNSPNGAVGLPGKAVQTAAWLPDPADPSEDERPRRRLDIPARLPGSEVPAIELPPIPPDDLQARAREIDRVYPDLPPMPLEPQPLAGPDSKPYALTDLQRLAAANRPELRQAAADVQSAYGAWVQAKTYANPQGSYFVDPNANNTSAGVQGVGIEQVIKTAGKQKLSAASAWINYENSLLALRRTRNEVATQVRQAYFSLLVDRETLAVTRAVAHFTDQIYRLQTDVLKTGQPPPYEPAALRAQAFTTRLAYQQAIATYIFDWKSLVAILGLRQLPLTQVGGQIDRLIPYYDYDEVLAYVLRNHTDIRAARNRVPQARYNLKLAQSMPIPDLDVAYRYAKDFAAFPFGSYSQFMLQMPLPVWDQNKGNIMSAQAALIRATEEQHNAEINLTNDFANAYTNYKNSLYGIEYYRRYILPDLVRYYRGIYTRRLVQPDEVHVGDLAFAQQSLSQNVTAYLGVLGSMWQSVVAVAAFLQTDDLFQMATPRPLPELPDFDEISRWACDHGTVAAPGGLEPNGVRVMAGPMARRGRVAPALRGGDPRAVAGSPPSDSGPTKNPPAGARGINSPSRSAGATLTSQPRSLDRQDDR